MQKIKGFTLIELLIVIVIVAILVAVGLPSYQESIRKSKRAIGKAALFKVLARQENNFVNNKAFATTLTDLGYGANPYYIDDDGAETTAANSIYQIALSGPTTTAYTVQAIPKNNQANDSLCGTLQLGHDGTKSISGGSGSVADCW